MPIPARHCNQNQRVDPFLINMNYPFSWHFPISISFLAQLSPSLYAMVNQQAKEGQQQPSSERKSKLNVTERKGLLVRSNSAKSSNLLCRSEASASMHCCNPSTAFGDRLFSSFSPGFSESTIALVVILLLLLIESPPLIIQERVHALKLRRSGSGLRHSQ